MYIFYLSGFYESSKVRKHQVKKQFSTLLKKMNRSDGVGNFVLNEEEMTGTSFDIFSEPEKESSTLWGTEREIRLLTILERFCLYKVFVLKFYTRN